MTATCDRWTLAVHEAAHAVMRWRRGMPCTRVTIDTDGGFCAGTGRPVRGDDELLVTLAGFAAETGYGLASLNVAEHRGIEDFDQARHIIENVPWLRAFPSAEEAERIKPGTAVKISLKTVDESLQHHFKRACEQLWPLADLVESIAERLDADGELSGRTVAAMCREYDKRESKSVRVESARMSSE